MRLTREHWPESLRPHLIEDAPLSALTWFKTGGPADILFTAPDEEALALFLKHLPPDAPLTLVGCGSNLLVRDGGVRGAVVRLGPGFDIVLADRTQIVAGGAARDASIAKEAALYGIGGCEFLIGVPGAIGGAVAMNAGCYGRSLSDVVRRVRIMTRAGKIEERPAEALAFSYRHSALAPDEIVLAATLEGTEDEPEAIRARMNAITAQRRESQPLGTRTGGSTFANPEGHKAWELIDRAGCRGLSVGGAQMSPLHCNFMINTGHARAADLEELGETVRKRVAETCGIMLEWEIRRIGVPA